MRIAASVFALLLACLMAIVQPSFAAPIPSKSNLGSANIDFPPLTGRVVDQAQLLSAEAETQLTDELAAQERATGNQMVIVTLPSLGGRSIEEYGVALGRHWGIGQKQTNSGLLLMVAPNERAVRIEVGYGLEGTITDALSSQIIQQIILPSFRAGQWDKGISDGTRALLAVLGGKDVPALRPAAQADISWPQALIMMLFLFVFVWRMRHNRRRMLGTSMILGGLSGGFRSGKGFGGSGGFSGGGGSFGGGGSSGRW